MEKEFIENEELNVLVKEVIVDNKLDLTGINIKSVLVSPYISKRTAARCIRPNNELRYFGEFDYLLEFSDKLWQGLSKEVKKILILHELKHILVTTDKNGNAKFKLAPHDVQDFFSIIHKHGINWLTDLKTIASSVYDFQNGEEDKIKI
jgi:hypothetical protein